MLLHLALSNIALHTDRKKRRLSLALPVFNSPKMPVDTSYFQTLALVFKNSLLKSFRMQCAIYSRSATATGEAHSLVAAH